MNSFVKNILCEWDLEAIIPDFEAKGVSERTFKNLSEKDIDILLDPVNKFGFNKDFKQSYEIWKNNNINAVTLPAFTILSQQPSQSSITSIPIITVTPSVNLTNSSDNSVIINSTDGILVNPINNKPRLSTLELLQQRTNGKKVLQEFKLYETVNTHWIAETVISYEYEYTNSYRITSKRLKELADDLAIIFKKKNQTLKKAAEVFYYQTCKSTVSDKGVYGGGALFYYHFNARKSLKSLNLVESNKSSNEELEWMESVTDIDWLKENDEPQEEVILRWENTFTNRPQQKADQVFLFYKGLRSSYGHLLLASDFDKLYPNTLPIRTEFLKIAPLINEICVEKKKATSLEKNLVENGKEYLAGLLNLARYFGKLTRKREHGILPYGSTSNQIVHSFIYFCTTKEEFQEHKVLRSALNSKIKKNIGPLFISFIGDFDKDETEEVEVLITFNSYDFHVSSNSLLDAVEFCFKAFMTLKVEFPNAIRVLWVFLKKVIFKIGGGPKFVSLRHFIDLINDKSGQLLIDIDSIDDNNNFVNDDEVSIENDEPSIEEEDVAVEE